MQAPMNEYYTDEEYQYALKQMYRMMERNRIIAEAKIAITAKWTLQYEEKFARVLKKRFLICYSSMMKFNKMVQSEWDKVRYFKSFLYHLSEKL